MKMVATLGIVAALTAWTLTVLMTMNLLSGDFETRTCQTGCVQSYFFSAVVTGFVALATGLLSAVKQNTRIIGVIALILAIPLCAIFSVFLIGMVA